MQSLNGIFISVEVMQELNFGTMTVRAVPLVHRVPSFAYVFAEEIKTSTLDCEHLKRIGLPQGPLWGQLKAGLPVKHHGQVLDHDVFVKTTTHRTKIIICGDNAQPDVIGDEAHGCDVLVHESTYTKDLADKAAEVGHSYASLVTEFAESMKIPNVILTHFSPCYQGGDSGEIIPTMKAEAAEGYNGKLWLAADFARYELRNGQLLKI